MIMYWFNTLHSGKCRGDKSKRIRFDNERHRSREEYARRCGIYATATEGGGGQRGEEEEESQRNQMRKDNRMRNQKRNTRQRIEVELPTQRNAPHRTAPHPPPPCPHTSSIA